MYLRVVERKYFKCGMYRRYLIERISRKLNMNCEIIFYLIL